MNYEFVYPEGKSLTDFTTTYDAVTETYQEGDFQPDAVRSAAKAQRVTDSWLARLSSRDRTLFCREGFYVGLGGVFRNRRHNCQEGTP